MCERYKTIFARWSVNVSEVREFLFQLDNTFHSRVNVLLVAEAIFFAAVSQMWATGSVQVTLVLIALGLSLTLILWCPLNVLQKRSKYISDVLKHVDPMYKDYLDAGPRKLMATWLLAHGIPFIFPVGWIALLIVRVLYR
jgi:hypothetical protein